MSPRRAVWAAIGLFLAVLLLAGLLTDIRKLEAALRDYPLWRVAPACGLVLGNYALRTIRFRAYMAALGERLGWREAGLVFVGGFLASVSPGKMGEVMKGFVLFRRRGIPIADTATVVVAERYTDVIGLLLLGAAGVGLGGVQLGHDPQRYAGLLAAVIGVCVVFLLGVAHPRLLPGLVARLQARTTRPKWLRALVGILRIHSVLRVLCAPRSLAFGTGLAAAAWLLECIAFRVLLDGVDARAGLAPAIVVYAVATLIGAVSMLPGGVGTTEAVMVVLCTQAAIGLHLPLDRATLVTLLIRFCTLWFGVMAGGLALWLLRRLPVQPLAAVQAREPAP